MPYVPLSTGNNGGGGGGLMEMAEGMIKQGNASSK